MRDTLIDSSFKYCEQIAKGHYENFPVASLLLPKEKRKYVYAIYAFARAADDFADEEGIEGGAAKRLALLDEWNGKLRDCYNGKVGSSARIIDGLFTSALAMATRCLCPPESSFGLCFILSCNPTFTSASSASSMRADLDIPA